MIWPAIKLVLVSGAFAAGLITPLVALPIEKWIFFAALEGAMGILITLWVILLNHLVWPKAKKWGMPTWSGGVILPWQFMNIVAMIGLAMGVSSGIFSMRELRMA